MFFCLHFLESIQFKTIQRKLSQIFIFTLISLFSLLGQTDSNVLQTQTLEAYVGRVIRETEKTPSTGVSVVVVKDGEVILARGYGVRDFQSKLPVTANTQFGIGSVTKSFTATSLAMLHQHGQLNMNQTVRSYLPNFRMVDSQAAQTATFVDLLSHRTGVPRHELFWLLTPFTGLSQVARIGYLEPNANPQMGFRRAFQYNNLMYSVAATALEQRASQSWETYVYNNLLMPLKMMNTSFSSHLLRNNPDHARPYFQQTQLKYYELSRIKAAGSINSSANDMAQWLKFQLRKGTDLQGRALVSDSIFTALWKPQIAVPFGNRRLAYGMGWFVEDLSVGRMIWHGGNVFGYSANIAFLPEKNMGIVVLTNQHASNIPNAVTGKVFQYLLAPKNKKANSQTEVIAQDIKQIEQSLQATQEITSMDFRTKNLNRSRIKNKGVTRTLAGQSIGEYLGTYSHPAYGDLTLLAANDNLWMKYYDTVSPIVKNQQGQLVFTYDVAGLTAEQPIVFNFRDNKVVSFSAIMDDAAGPSVFQKR